jgi:hypothetical protein
MEQTGMTKLLKMLGGSGLAVVLGVVLLGLSGAFGATTVSAESPPNPPSRFVGSVTIDGKPAFAGTTIQVRIGSTTCGVTAVFTASGEARYAVDSPALDPGATPNCGTDGATVTFLVGDKVANETGVWHNYQLNTVNLTVTTPTPSATPKPPVTGSGTTDSAGSAVWLFAMLGLGAVAFGVGGVAAARKR